MMRAITLALACLVGANAIVAQNTPAKNPADVPQPEQTPAPKTPLPAGRITGIVICSDTRRPGRGIRVDISRDPTPDQHDGVLTYAMTDVDGRYLFEHLSPGDYVIRVHANGYLYLPPQNSPKPSQAPTDTSIAANRITVHSNETATFDVSLQRSASLSGRVFFDDGSPAIAAEIRVEKIDLEPFYKPKPGEPSYMPLARFGNGSVTDERGYFRITTLGSGTYRIAALPMFQTRSYLYDDHNNSAVETGSKFPNSLAIFSGDTIHRSQAQTYKLRLGDDISDIHITIPLAGLYKVRGAISANDGRTPNTGMVTLVDNTDSDIHFRTVLNTDGSFAFAAIPSGTYKLIMSHVYIAKPDIRFRGYSDDDAVIDTNAFSDVESAVIVKNSDILDLHYEVHEIPLPPKPVDDDPGSF